MKPMITRTPEQLEKLSEYARKNDLPEDIYENFVSFATYFVPYWGHTDKLPWEWFHYYMAKQFQELFSGELTYLTLETHSQIGKSVLVALFICYVFGSNPNKNVMYFTYNEAAATKFTKEYILFFMGSEKWKKVFPFVVLKNELDKADHTAKNSMKKKISTLKDNEFNVINPLNITEEYRGKYVAFGIGQGSHGRPADVMIVDDYVAKTENIYSENFRNKLKQAFDTDIILRFQASTIFLVICTRWYDSDPIGQLMDKMPIITQGFEELGLTPPKFKSIKIRAQYRIADDNPPEDPRTKEGEWLWMPMLAKYLAAKNSDNFNATFNCDPSDLTEMRQLTDEDFGYYYPEDIYNLKGRIFICMDAAATTGKRSDHTAIGAWMVYGRKRYLLKLWYIKNTTPQLCRLLEHILTVEYPNYYACLIEFANAGQAVSQHLQEKQYKNIIPLGFTGKELSDTKILKRSKKDITSRSNSKVDRYYKMLPEFQGEEKRILLPAEPIEHQDIFLSQLKNFSGERGAKDDMVDMCSYLIIYTINNVVVRSGVKPTTSTTNRYQSHNMQYSLGKNANYFIRR